MPITKTHFWQKTPFLRLLIPLAAGIILQWYVQSSVVILSLLSVFTFLFVVGYSFVSLKQKYQFSALSGLMLYSLLALLGSWLAYIKDVRHHKNWIGHQENTAYVLIQLAEPLIEKQNSFKALAHVQYTINKSTAQKATGKLIVYFQKDSSVRSLTYGSHILLSKPLQKIKNAGNPGGFNYERYCLFQGITHQVFLKATDFTVLSVKKEQWLNKALFTLKNTILYQLRRFITSPKEQGLAEALLIGYKDDLDKTLVQSYSNTGVVHVIAISGLHLGLIYWLLVLVTKPLKRNKGLSWLRFLAIIAGLWAFSLIAGAQPSVLRSAVMFSCMALGELIGRKSSIYNTMALSAFALLCINPFWLWDVGFQLSYTAVLSIIVFYRSIANWFCPSNKYVSWFWKLNAVTLAAQVLTLPLLLFHFHQFPLLFLFANMLAVPLSSIVLGGELVLLVFTGIPGLAYRIGWLLEKMIWFMNAYVEKLEGFSFAIWNGFSISILQVCLLYALIAAFGFWILEKQKGALWYSISCLLLFFTLRSYSFFEAQKQKELIVYNVPQHQAIDLVSGRFSSFVGDKALTEDNFLRNFHLQPSRVLHRTHHLALASNKHFRFASQNVLIIDTTVHLTPSQPKEILDLLILSKNPRLYISDLQKTYLLKQIVVDGSVPLWKKKLWKKDCDSLHLPFFDVAEKGAFVMKVQ